MKLYHLIQPERWQQANDEGVYAPPSLVTEGFVHMSFERQVELSANRHYATADSLVALVFDSEAFGDKLVVEDTSGHGEFPHLYRAITPSEVERVVTLVRGADGWQLPAE